MAIGPVSVEQICNEALGQLGYAERIGDMYEGSVAALVFLDIYAQTRDALLRSRDWPFAMREVALTASSEAPPQGWSYAYLYPADCIRLKAIQPAVIPVPDYDPQEIRFGLFDDTRTSPPTKTIVTTIPDATGVYIGQVTDYSSWDPGFTEALIQALAAKAMPGLRAGLAPVVSPDSAIADATEADEPQPPNDAAAPPRPQDDARPLRGVRQ